LADGDNDGLPDTWETAHGLDPKDEADANSIVPAGASPNDRHQGYTFIEYYINDLADQLAAKAVADSQAWLPPLPLPAGMAPAKVAYAPPPKPIKELVADVLAPEQGDKALGRSDWKGPAITAQYAIIHLSQCDPALAAEAIAPLLAALPTTDPRRAMYVSWAIGGIGGDAAKSAVPALQGVLEQEWVVTNVNFAANPRGFAAWALGRIGPSAEAAIPALGAALHGPDRWARRTAAWALARIGASAAPQAEALVRSLAYNGHPEWNAHVHAIEALSAIGAPAVPALVAALDNRNDDVRRGVVAALGGIGRDAAAATARLSALCGDIKQERRLRLAAAAALVRVEPGEQSAMTVAKLLDDEDYGLRAAAARIFGAMATKPPHAVMERLAKSAAEDPRPEVRYAAARACGRHEPEGK
jgi:HEAT repeat protein